MAEKKPFKPSDYIAKNKGNLAFSPSKEVVFPGKGKLNCETATAAQVKVLIKKGAQIFLKEVPEEVPNKS